MMVHNADPVVFFPRPMQAYYSRPSLLSLLTLPPELLHEILLYLDIPDLLSISRVSHYLRHLALDPHLHHLRLASASTALKTYLPHRPSASSLRPPTSSILLSRTHIIARAISRSLISIRLARNLSSRPAATDLVSRHILPAECVGYLGPVAPGILQRKLELGKRKLRDGLNGKLERRMSAKSLVDANILPEECFRLKRKRSGGGGGGKENSNSVSSRSRDDEGFAKTIPMAGGRTGNDTHEQDEGVYGYVAVAPGLVETRRKVIKEGLKDGLRAWVEKRALLVQKRARTDMIDPDYYYYHNPNLPRIGMCGHSEDQRNGHNCQQQQQQQHQRLSVKLLARHFAMSIQQECTSNSRPRSTKTDCGNCTCDKHAMQRRGRDGKTRRWERPMPPPSMLPATRHGGCAQPTRAHVLGLRRFWEGVIKGSA